MNRTSLAVHLLLIGCLVIAGCGGSEETPKAEQGTAGHREPLDEATAAAARTRGIPRDEPVDVSSDVVHVVMSEITYEWRAAPETGLEVVVEFANPAGGGSRAKGYVFLVAESWLPGFQVSGVYPWDAPIVDGLPEDYTDGAHLLYRDRQQVRAFIPYKETSGYYERLTVLVYYEDGRLVTSRTYDLELTGTVGERRTMDLNPDFDL